MEGNYDSDIEIRMTISMVAALDTIQYKSSLLQNSGQPIWVIIQAV